MNWEEEQKLKIEQYLGDIDTAIRILETLKTDFITPGWSHQINSSKVQRIRLVVHDLLKKY